MLKRLRAKLTYANVMVTILAVLVVGGSGAYAAVKLGNNAVKTKNLKNNAVKTAKIADGAVTEPKIGNDAVTSAKIAAGAVTSGKVGGGVLRDMIIVSDRTPDSGEQTGNSLQAFPTCPAGYVIVGGGGQILDDEGAEDEAIVTDLPIGSSGPGFSQWFVQADDVATGDDDDWALFAQASCVKA